MIIFRHVIARWRLSRTIWLMLGIFVLALVPRALAAGDFLTADEARFWFGRVERFLQAVQQGDYAETNQVGHPGVTTMWLGSLGILVHQWAVSLGVAEAGVDNLYRVCMRVPVAVVTALQVALAYPLLRRLFQPRVALLSVLFIATDPFLVAHGQVLHLDGLLTAFVTLSLLAALVACRGKPVSWGWLVASAGVGGLALLTKSPSVVLLPIIGLTCLVGFWRWEQCGLRDWRCWLFIGWRALVALLAWISIASLVWVAFWPAVWVNPYGSVLSIVQEVQSTGGSLHSWGNFFLGEPVNDPGWLYYPVIIAFRLTPWTMVGLLLALVAAFAWLLVDREQWIANNELQAVNDESKTTDYRLQTIDREPQMIDDRRSSIILLVLFVLLFIILMSLSPKKFDRYLLPIFPMLNIFAALGWFWLCDHLPMKSERFAMQRDSKAKAHRLALISLPAFFSSKMLALFGWITVVILLGINLAWYHPYTFAYYNPLLGGGSAAQRTLLIGWGEGLEQAGRYISNQFNGCDRPVAAWYEPVLIHFACTDIVPLHNALLPGNVDYIVLYINQMQRGIDWEVVTLARSQGSLLHTVRIHGIDYAYVYQLPQPVAAQALEANFGTGVRLHGYTVDSSAIRAAGVLSLTVQWQATDVIDHDYLLFVHVLDATGQVVGQIDVPPGDPRAPTSAWQPGQSVYWVHPLPLPTNLPAGRYWMSLGVYDAQTFARLPVDGPLQPDAPDDGLNTLFLDPFVLP